MPTNKTNPIMQYFEYAHLPAHLKGTSQVIANVAKLLYEQLPDGPEKSSGLRKLLEAKDCFVRSALNAPNAVQAGELSDGYHSYNELYAHRMQLFAVVCKQNQAQAWKSKQHHDKPMYPGYFIVGVETPMGQFTYHYPMLHWGMFQVRELDKAPEWDGHTADDVVRLHSLDSRMMTEHERLELEANACRLTVLEGQLKRSHDTHITNEVNNKLTGLSAISGALSASEKLLHDNYTSLRSRADQE